MGWELIYLIPLSWLVGVALGGLVGLIAHLFRA